MDKPYSESSEQNRAPILAVIKPLFSGRKSVLEVGSGTGQHAVCFGTAMPHLMWHCSDVLENLPGIRLWVEEANLPNVSLPAALDVKQPDWPTLDVDTVFSSNTTHIMHWHEVEAFFSGVGRILPVGGLFALYGPFNYDGSYTSESNARFDAWLKARDPHSGIRDIGDLQFLAAREGLALKDDFAMPVNNRLLCWEKM